MPPRKLIIKPLPQFQPKPAPAKRGPLNAVEAQQVVGRNIKRLRNREGKRMSQEALAEAAEMHRPDLSDLERGKHNPQLETLRRIARALGVSLSELLRGAD